MLGEHNKNKSAAAAFLNSLDDNELTDVITNPPGQTAEPTVLAVPIDVSADGVEPLLQLTGPQHLLSFGNHGCSLPDDKLSPLLAPAWLAEALKIGSDSAKQLVGMYILYKWPPRLGGWAVGKVTSSINDPSLHVKNCPCNFAVFYDCDQESADHCLSIASYAKSAKSAADSWVLLG